MTDITLNKGGTAECVVDSHTLHIPDAWPAATYLDDIDMTHSAENVRKVWHIAHDLLRHICEARLAREPATERALSWANQQSYSFAADALDTYCAARGLNWSSDAMYSFITFTEI